MSHHVRPAPPLGPSFATPRRLPVEVPLHPTWGLGFYGDRKVASCLSRKLEEWLKKKTMKTFRVFPFRNGNLVVSSQSKLAILSYQLWTTAHKVLDQGIALDRGGLSSSKSNYQLLGMGNGKNNRWLQGRGHWDLGFGRWNRDLS